ncbi:hypothetical protein B0H10DRAFT_2023169 [Mycena sp. CBHHK59/15]|nr:hypothetical protein B0H10DRAFT_2023169 [Mycena sp. CBHHK59/15]
MPDSLPCRCTYLLAVNYAPLQSEATHICNMISKHEQEFEEINIKIAVLLSRWQGLMKHIQGLKFILSHIHHLPEEILTLIFILMVPKAESWFPHSDMDSYYMPVHNVCKCWRAVSLSCQVLWLRRVILDNSRLSLSCSSSSLLGMAGLLEAIVRFPQCWSALDITCRSDWTKFRNQLDHLKGNVGQLREVQIVGIWSSEAAQWGGDQFESFTVVPWLQTLTVAHVHDPAQSLLLPLHQLTKYCSTGHTDYHLRIDDMQLLVEIVLNRQHRDPIFPLLSLCLLYNPLLSCVFLLPGTLVAATGISLLEQTSTITTLHIHLTFSGKSKVFRDHLLDVVESHWKHESGNLDCTCWPLEQIEFLDPGWPWFQLVIAERLRALEEEGMHMQDWRYPCQSIS